MEHTGTTPIIVGGLQGSGTTMLVQTLDKHRNIVGYNETQIIQILSVMDEKLLGTDSKLHTRFLSRYFDDAEIIDAIRGFTEKLLMKDVLKRNKKRWAEKTPENHRHWHLWTKLFPGCKCIHIIRDGRDIVSSGISYGYYKTEGGARAWVRSINESRKQIIGDLRENYLEIRYEDLLKDSATCMNRILKFIGEEHDDAVFELAKSSKFTRKWGENANPQSPIGRWKNDPQVDKEIFKEIAGNMLVELDYEKDLNW